MPRSLTLVLWVLGGIVGVCLLLAAGFVFLLWRNGIPLHGFRFEDLGLKTL